MPSNDVAIGERHLSVARSRTFRNLREMLGLARLRVLDVGCGYGEYLASFGKESLGITTTPNEVEYGTRAGLPIELGNAEDLSIYAAQEPFDAVWANNLFEHLLAPHAFLIELKTVVRDGGILVLGVPMLPTPSVLMRIRRFRGALASNHIGFYTPRALRLTVERAGWKVSALRPFFFRNVFLDSFMVPFSPHLYLVAENDASFRYPEKKLKEWQDDPRYARLIRATEASA